MATKKTVKVSVGYPIFGILGLIFITLKLGGWGVVATWSWWWVLAPFWIPFAITFALLAFALLAFILVCCGIAGKRGKF